jgi:hypothetical protein
MGDYYDPTRNGGYLGKEVILEEKSENAEKSDNQKAARNGGHLQMGRVGCALAVLALLIVCVTIVILAMIFTGYHF